jgi:YVTN family beta-propeller protein
VPDLSDQYMYIVSCAHEPTFKWVDVGASQTCVAYDSVDNLLYFGMAGTDSLAALSCVTDSVVSKVALPFEPATLGYSPQSNLLYAAEEGDIEVLAGGTGEVVASLRTWFSPSGLAYRAEGNKLYCSEDYGDELAIVDAVSGTALGLRKVGASVANLSYIRGNDKLYCGMSDYLGDSTLYILQCATDSVRQVASAGVSLADFCYSPAGNKVYCANSGYSDSAIIVLDGTTDSILRRVRVGFPTEALDYNPTWNKVYATTNDQQVVTVLDAAADTIVARTRVPFYPQGVLYVERESVACCYGGDSVAFLDGTSNQVVDVTPVAGSPEYALYNPVGNKLYLGCDYIDTVSVIDMATLQLTALVPVSGPTYALEFDSTANRVYCLGASSYFVVTVIDGRGDTAIGQVQTLPYPRTTVWAEPLRRLFVSVPHYAAVEVITDTSHVGVLECGTIGRGRAGASVVRGVLFLPANGDGRRANYDLLDITGRRVLVLRSGPNDVSGLAPGVYFVREKPQNTSPKPQAMRKVILGR